MDGIRYLEKPPLPYWLAAADYHLFGYNVFATHLPLTLGVLGLAILAWAWGRRAYGDRAAFYAALSILTSVGVFLFTRIFIPEVLLTLLLALALYNFLIGLEDDKPLRFYLTWAALALAMLAKGLVAPVFFFAAAVPYLWLTGDWRRWRQFRLLSGILLFLAIAAPWHILAGLRNPGAGHPAGQHSQPGQRPRLLLFLLHQRAGAALSWPALSRRLQQTSLCSLLEPAPGLALSLEHLSAGGCPAGVDRPNPLAAWRAAGSLFHCCAPRSLPQQNQSGCSPFTPPSSWSFSPFPPTRSTTPIPCISPCCCSLPELWQARKANLLRVSKWLTGAHAALALIGIVAAIALGYGLWSSRAIPSGSDIGALLAHRDVAGYTLSMSHLFDLTGPSFAALRLPAGLAAAVLLLGPVVAWVLRRQRHHFEATVSVAFTSAVFLIAAHIALVRFEPMLSSRAMADTINHIAKGGSDATLILYGDVADGSSLLFYTQRQALLVNGRVSSMLWGSNYPDAPPVLISDADLLALWGNGPRRFLFVPGDVRAHVAGLLGTRAYLLQELSDKALYTDRPL